MIARWRGEYEAALAHLGKLDQISNTLPAPGFRMLPLATLAGLYLDISEDWIEQSQACQAEALATLADGDGAFGSLAWKEIALSRLVVTDLANADNYLQNGLAAQDSYMYLVRPSLLIGQALLALARGQLTEAADHTAQAREFVEARQMKNYYPLIALTAGRVSAAAGKREAALEQFARAESLAREMGMRPYVWQAHTEMARELSLAGRAAQAMIDETAALMADVELRSAFLRSARRKIG